MENIDFLVKLLESNQEYWVVSKKTSYRKYMETKRGEDCIILIVIPEEFKMGINKEDIKFTDLDKLNNKHIVCNIYLNTEYPPFQLGLQFNDVYDGFELGKNINTFISESISLDSNNLSDYKSLYDEINKTT